MATGTGFHANWLLRVVRLRSRCTLLGLTHERGEGRVSGPHRYASINNATKQFYVHVSIACAGLPDKDLEDMWLALQWFGAVVIICINNLSPEKSIFWPNWASVIPRRMIWAGQQKGKGGTLLPVFTRRG